MCIRDRPKTTLKPEEKNVSAFLCTNNYWERIEGLVNLAVYQWQRFGVKNKAAGETSLGVARVICIKIVTNR